MSCIRQIPPPTGPQVGTGSNSPPVYIGSNLNQNSGGFPPFLTPFITPPDKIYRKCEVDQDVLCPPNTIGEFYFRSKRTIFCNREEYNRDSANINFIINNLGKDPEVYSTEFDGLCTDFSDLFFSRCVPQAGNCIEITNTIVTPTGTGTGGPATTDPSGTNGGGPVTVGPNTGVRSAFKKCVVFSPPTQCPPGTVGPPITRREVFKCTARDSVNDSVAARSRQQAGQGWDPNGTWNDNAKGLCLPDSPMFEGCRPDPNLCVPEEIRNRPMLSDFQPLDQGGGGTTTNIRIDQSVSLGEFRLSRQSNNSQVTKQGSIDNAAVKSKSLVSNIQLRQVTQSNLPNSNYSNYLYGTNNRSYFYDPIYNFFKYDANQNTRMVSNDKHLSIFADVVAEEVKYFLDLTDSNIPWNEKTIQSLTNDKIIVSLRQDVLFTINNIQSVTNSYINSNNFVNAIKSHLMQGTLNEFDIRYFFDLYSTQREEPIISQQRPSDLGEAIAAALTIFGTKSVNSDYRTHDTISIRNDMKRNRFLLEDIEAKIPSLQVDGNQAPLNVKNAGIITTQIGGITKYLNIGNGGGYSFDTSTVDDQDLPLTTTNESSSAYYLRAADRIKVLNLFGFEDSIQMSVSSLNGIHEFNQDYNFSSLIEPLYFAIEFSTVTDVFRTESAITQISATYRLISEEEAVTHSRNYSFNLIKVNLDYRDPFVHYSRDSSSINAICNEFNLRSFGVTRTPVDNKIILRNVPAAIILTPGRGAFHNPYNIRSTISEISDTVVRAITVTPAFDPTLVQTDTPLFSPVNSNTAVGTPYYGLHERQYEQRQDLDIYTYDKNSEIFRNSYFINNEYTQTIQDQSLFERSPEARLSLLVDKLSDVSGVSSLTWWDVYRRLNINDIGKLTFNNGIDIINKISSGWRGIPVRSVISSPSVSPTGIPAGSVIDNDTIIINEADRYVRN